MKGELPMENNIREGRMSVVTLLVRLFIDLIATIILVGFVWIIKDLITFFTTKITVTNRKFSGHTGLINTSHLDCPLNKISGVQVQQGLFGKIFNYGTIIVSTSSTVARYMHISNPNDFVLVLNNLIEEYDELRLSKQIKNITRIADED